MKSAKPTTRLDWENGWDAESGLWWWDHSGHTASTGSLKRVRGGPDAATRLLVAGQAGCLDQIDVFSVLSALRNMQNLSGGQKHGRFRWYLEDTTDEGDEHALFFNGLPLLVLWALYRNDLPDPRAEKLLADLHKDSFQYNLKRAVSGNIFYPNEYLGEAVCAWLQMEFFQMTDARDDLVQCFGRAAEYLLEHHWGWGEHLSDTYAKICIDELSLLLLLAKDLPDALRANVKKLLAELMDLEDFFAGGPAIPAVRNYTFARIPTGLSYRETVRPLPVDATFESDPCLGARLATYSTPLKTASGGTWLPLGHSLHELGWHELVANPQAASPRRAQKIQCTDDVSATAFIEGDTRLGSLSRFPLMSTAEWSEWGLAWQCFPVALWQREKLWGFLQWETFEAGRRLHHPAQEKYGGPRTLTSSVQPPIVGQTCARQREGDLLALRIMPAIAASWEELTDRFRFVGAQTKVVSERSEGDWSQIVLDCGDRQIAVACLRLSGGPGPTQKKTGTDILDWSVCYSADDLANRRGAVNLWGISLSGPIEKAPVVLPDPDAHPLPRGHESQALLVRWEWPNGSWNLKIDLMHPELLQCVTLK